MITKHLTFFSRLEISGDFPNRTSPRRSSESNRDRVRGQASGADVFICLTGGLSLRISSWNRRIHLFVTRIESEPFAHLMRHNRNPLKPDDPSLALNFDVNRCLNARIALRSSEMDVRALASVDSEQTGRIASSSDRHRVRGSSTPGCSRSNGFCDVWLAAPYPRSLKVMNQHFLNKPLGHCRDLSPVVPGFLSLPLRRPLLWRSLSSRSPILQIGFKNTRGNVVKHAK